MRYVSVSVFRHLPRTPSFPSASGQLTSVMAAANARYLCSYCRSFLISRIGTKICFCRSLATQAVRRRSQSCRPTPTLSASFRTCDFERWCSTAGPGTGEKSKSSRRDWMQYLSRFSPTVDVSSVSRALTSLHVDIPRNLPEIRRFVPSISVTRLQRVVSRNNVPTHDRMPNSVGLLTNHIAEPSAAAKEDSHSKPDAAKLESTATKHESGVTQQEEHWGSERLMSVITGDERAISDAIPAPQHVSDSVTSSADRSPAAAAASAGQLTDSVMSKVNTVASGIAKQIAEYMPSGDSSGPMPAKQPTRLQQHRQTLEADGKEKSAADVKKEVAPAPKQVSIRRQLVARGSIERQTRGMVLCLRDARTSTSQLVRLEELCRHISLYPDCTGIAIKSKVVPCLLRLRESRDTAVAESSREALALVGYVDAVHGRGIRVLSLDGGGTKGLVTLSIMKHLEELSRKPIYELFDYVCGVSTGALIGAMAAVYRVPATEMEEVYKEFSVQMFERNRLVGTGKLFTSHAYYDTELWERILRENIGEQSLLATNKDGKCPKFSAISTLVNVPRVQNFLFRNYNLPSARQSHYAGSTEHCVWEAIRASSAAPGYYEEYQLGEFVHQDGGLLTNNPAAIAIHECRQLWPDTPLQCVISVGTGKFEPTALSDSGSPRSSLKRKVAKLVESATDTEAVHTVLHDLLPASSYFRFNPYMSEQFLLDEVRADKWEQMRQDAEMYCRKNAQQLDRAVAVLLQPKPVRRRVADALKCRLDSIG